MLRQQLTIVPRWLLSRLRFSLPTAARRWFACGRLARPPGTHPRRCGKHYEGHVPYQTDGQAVLDSCRAVGRRNKNQPEHKAAGRRSRRNPTPTHGPIALHPPRLRRASTTFSGVSQ
jgi:hypothetical protein